MNTSSLLTAATAAVLVACASSSSPLRPTRDSRISDLSDAACDKYADKGAGCPGYGTAPGQTYKTTADCKRALANAAGMLWPADTCGEGRIRPDRYASCEDRVESYRCPTGAVSFLEGISALEGCQSSKVCIDPR
jgi:hypothetical protein